jgi:hypothetical protein
MTKNMASGYKKGFIQKLLHFKKKNLQYCIPLSQRFQYGVCHSCSLKIDQLKTILNMSWYLLGQYFLWGGGNICSGWYLSGSVFVRVSICSGQCLFRSVFVQVCICLGQYLFWSVFVQVSICWGQYLLRSVFVWVSIFCQYLLGSLIVWIGIC